MKKLILLLTLMCFVMTGFSCGPCAHMVPKKTGFGALMHNIIHGKHSKAYVVQSSRTKKSSNETAA